MKLGIVIGLVALTAVAAKAQVQLGAIVLGGTACQLAGVGPIEAIIEEGKLSIPAAIMAKKTSAQTLTRGSCSFTLPVQVDAGYRLVLSDSSTLGLVNLSKGSRARVSVELFKAGERGQQLVLEETAIEQKIRRNFELNQSGTVIALGCGESTNIRGNASIMLQGSGRATASLQLIEMNAHVEACE